ncbi:hypothetical protein WJX72_007169 [[Myrmecia] bisecta]|uniref:Mog1p/PsbP-like protein n=1 Tax=[Myrmecia] bisecta TaxID=41462 RepID=A0AAW1Q7L2_9CHLO
MLATKSAVIVDAAPADAGKGREKVLLAHRHPSRRAALLQLSTLVSTTSLWATRPATADEPTAVLVQPQTSAVTAITNASSSSSFVSEGELYSTLEFSLEVPAGYELVPDQPTPTTTSRGSQSVFSRPGAPPPPSPVKAKFTSSDGAQLLSVVVQQASDIKPTFFQVTDIAQYGSLDEASRLLVPRGARLLASSTQQVVPQPRDTGTPLGVVAPPPQTIYRYEFVTRSGLHVTMAAAAKGGRVFVAGGSAADSQWTSAAEALQHAVESFRLN